MLNKYMFLLEFPCATFSSLPDITDDSKAGIDPGLVNLEAIIFQDLKEG